MPLGSFWAFKFLKLFIKENVKHSQIERVQDAINKWILLINFFAAANFKGLWDVSFQTE